MRTNHLLRSLRNRPGSRLVPFACLLLLSIPAWAATYIVNSTADPGDGDQTVLIDGTSQPGFSGAPLITIDAAIAGTGLSLNNAIDSTIRSIAIENAETAGISIQGGSGHIIQDVIASWPGPSQTGRGVDRYQSSGNTVERVTALNREVGIGIFFADATLHPRQQIVRGNLWDQCRGSRQPILRQRSLLAFKTKN